MAAAMHRVPYIKPTRSPDAKPTAPLPMPPHTRRLREMPLEMRRLLADVLNTAVMLMRAREAIAAAHGISSARWVLLRTLALSEYCLSISDLARAMQQARQSVHRLATDMARAGLLRFATHPRDRRVLIVELTAAGRSVLESVEQEYVMWAGHVAIGLDRRELTLRMADLQDLRERMARWPVPGADAPRPGHRRRQKQLPRSSLEPP